MTESVKFPGTPRIAPIEVHLWPYPIDRTGHEWDFEYEPEPDDKTIRYLRSDTATPNDQVVEMLLDAFGRGYLAGMVHEDSRRSSVSEAVDEQVWDVINDIRSRYAASDSD